MFKDCEPLYTPTEIDKEIEAVEHYFDKSAPWQFRAKKQLGKDVLEIKDPFEKKTRIELEEASEDHFAKHVTRDADGRYVVSLPWIPCHSFLSNCRNLAERRLKNCVRSLERSNNLGKYETVFHNLLNKDIIEEVQKDADKKNEHYLSHHPVYKDNSTTKIRPVFDGAAKEKTSSSINECLEKGPNMLELIPTIINKFRLRNLAKFNLRGWEHTGVSEAEKGTLLEEEKKVPVLGLIWKPEKDTLSVKWEGNSKINDIPTTKRKILSAVHRIFDPIVFTCPVTLEPKILLQEYEAVETKDQEKDEETSEEKDKDKEKEKEKEVEKEEKDDQKEVKKPKPKEPKYVGHLFVVSVQGYYCKLCPKFFKEVSVEKSKHFVDL
ncbi:DUF1758 domain-containing protein [Trichonephila clavipes]|nr:DUF1758 domain-containing protein [Trichonephila clavipes]